MFKTLQTHRINKDNLLKHIPFNLLKHIPFPESLLWKFLLFGLGFIFKTRNKSGEKCQFRKDLHFVFYLSENYAHSVKKQDSITPMKEDGHIYLSGFTACALCSTVGKLNWNLKFHIPFVILSGLLSELMAECC